MFRLSVNRDPDPAAEGAAAAAAAAAAPAVEPVVTAPTSASTTIPASPAAAAKPDETKYSFFETVPADLKEKPYMKDVTNFDQLYKKWDGAQELIGKRPGGIPGDDAPAEEKEAFARSWGRPEKAEGYESPKIELPEGVKKDPELEKFAKEIFFEAGLNQNQVNIIQGKYEAKILEMAGAAAADPAMSDEAFDTMTADLFKDRKETVLANGKLLLTENLPESLKGHIDKLDNNALVVLSAVLDGVREKYIAEDVMPREGDVTGGAESIDELRAQARVLMAKPEFTSKSDKGHAVVKAEVDGIYERIARIEARNKK